jgi:hypothetical protein
MKKSGLVGLSLMLSLSFIGCSSQPARTEVLSHVAVVPTSEQVADRMAILNLLGSYGSYCNEGNIDGWASLFADDLAFEIVFPEAIHTLTKEQFVGGEVNVFSIYRERLTDPKAGERRLFMLMNPSIRSQSAETAEVAITLMLVRINPEGPAPHIESTATYTGTLIKRDNRWLILRWRVQNDRNPEPLQEGQIKDAPWEPAFWDN